ncbi:MAG: DUF483 domain-containing protein [Candidatus Nanohaloarchaeota archaeon QJJ-7]|nr:DUF483 domain-containing protein [Candidatus Nanohaloarchaeota archaeon QJJ-7]
MYKENNNIPIGLSNFVGVKYDVKPVSRSGYDRKDELGPLKKLCERASINLKTVKTPIYDVDEETKLVYISKDQDKIEEAIKAEHKGDRNRIGSLLGYPSCCIDKFQEKLGKKDLLKELWKQKGETSYLMNTLYNFSGRKIPEKDSIKKHFASSTFYLPHQPCSLDCKKSLKMAKEIRNGLKKDFPEQEGSIRKKLQGTFLYFDDLNFATFTGRKTESGIAYDEVLTELSNIEDEKIMRAIDEGDNIIEDEGLHIRRGNDSILNQEDGTTIFFE